ncbi:hypothetical protein GB937_001343 [Aspergillus fischeri]|nr:hypothetical protein GB937_001343 [Aspergillus fischeri]
MRGTKRPRTIWAANSAGPDVGESFPAARESSQSPDRSRQRSSASQNARCQVRSQNPWVHYKAEAEVLCGREVTLATHRKEKGLVHIQCLRMDRSAVQSRIEMIDRCRHSSFPRLLDVYGDGERHFLVWEPVEFSLQHLLETYIRLSEADIAQLIRPVCLPPVFVDRLLTRSKVLEGIRFLQSQGLALAALHPNTIMLTEDGDVKIGMWPEAYMVGRSTDARRPVGVEDSCRIAKEDMHADTLKLTAVAVIVEDLMNHVTATMKLWGQPHSWGPEINSFLRDLRRKSLDALLGESFLASAEAGSLKWLASTANKEVRHELKLLDAEGVGI